MSSGACRRVLDSRPCNFWALREKRAEQIYPFARNMRQSAQIGRFLQGFYEAAFGERPTFDVNVDLDDKKPQLIIAQPQYHTLRIRQIVNVFRQSGVVNSVAVLQINEDDQALKILRAELEEVGVALAPAWAASGVGVLTTSGERIKGLEFDACIILGLEDVERAALNFTLNRAYVALSRPARRLALICTDYPPLLRKVDKALFDEDVIYSIGKKLLAVFSKAYDVTWDEAVQDTNMRAIVAAQKELLFETPKPRLFVYQYCLFLNSTSASWIISELGSPGWSPATLATIMNSETSLASFAS